MKNIARFRSTAGLLLFALAMLLAACGGYLTSGPSLDSGSGTGSGPGSGPVTGSGSVALFVRDAPMEELVEFEVIVTDVILDPGTVSVLSQPIRLELTGLQLTSEMIHLELQSVPEGSYTSVTVMLLDPKIKFCPDPPLSCTDQSVLNIVLAVNPSSSTSTINFGVTADQVTALLLDFDLRAMVVTDTLDITGTVTGFDPFGNILVTVLDVAGQPGEFEDEVGRVVSVNATASSFVFEPFGSCEQLTIATDVATQFAAFDRISLTNTFSSLQAGQVVEVNADLKIDASFVAEKVEFEDDATEDETQGFITDVTRATGPSQDSFGLVLMDVTPCTASLPLVEVARVDVSTLLGVVDFLIDDDGFTTVDPALFDGAEDLVAGQKVSLDPVQALGLSPLTAQQIRLEDVTILGTVDNPISSLAFNLVPRAAFMAGVDPSITVQLSTADTGFENLPNGTSDLFVGREVRVRGLLFRDAAGELFLVAKRVDGNPIP